MQDDQQQQTESVTPPRQSTVKNNLGIPVAIVIAAGLISGAIYFSGNTTAGPAAAVTAETGNDQVTPEQTIEPVSEGDHIRGNPNAPIVIVEYSDYDCPFCKNFHNTMNQIMDKYGTDGKVAWVYRHFPLEQLHPNAPKIAAGGECVAELGGNEAFWTYSDLVFSERGTNEQTNPARLPEFAASAGVDRAAFESCLQSGKYDEQIAEDVQEAIAAGGRGTPHSIVMVGGQQGVINGAQPFSVVDQMIGNLITQIEGGEL